MEEKIVTSQAELDAVPADYNGRIIIKFGTPYNRAVVRRAFLRSVEARDNSSVEARDNSSVVARENSSVVARGNAQVVDRSDNHKIKTNGNARVVYMPKTIEEFMSFYGVRHTKTESVWYKAVHKDGETYRSDADKDYVYVIGRTHTPTSPIDTDPNRDCGSGLHISHLAWALDFGKRWEDLAILEVETKTSDIVLPVNSDGKVRTSRLKVLREVPLSDCGIMGKILSKGGTPNE